MGRLAKLGSDHGVQMWARLFGGAPDFGQRPDTWKPTPAFGAAGERVGRIRQPLDRDIDRPYGQQKPLPGGSYGRSALTSQGNAFVRLLQAMRSNAPGGWSDDRYEQTLRHFVGITYVAIHRLSTQFSRAEFQVFHEDPDVPEGKRPVRRGERAWELVQLLKRPNKQDTFGRLMYRWSLQRRLTGTALTWVVPNALGDPFEIYSIPTALAIPQAATNPDYPEGFYRIQPIYPYGPFSSFPAPASSVGAPISAQWMMRFQYPHPLLRYEGYSPLTGMRLHIDALEMVDRARHYLMRRGIHPSAVLNSVDAEAGTNELDDTEIERIRADFEAGHMGPENYGRLFVAYAGRKLENWGNPPSEMAFDSSWDQLSSFILGGGFGITKQAAGMIEDSSYSTLFATLKQLHLVTIEPECVSEDTPLITRDGAGAIADFVNTTVDVWNGKKWSSVVVRKIGENRTLVRVRFSDGSHLDCTPDHRFSVTTNDERKKGKGWRVVEAKDLLPGMATETFRINHEGGTRLEDAYTLGVIFGDGRTRKNVAMVDLFGEKMKLPVTGQKSEEKWKSGCKVPYIHVRCGGALVRRLNDLRADLEAAWWDMFSLDRISILEFLAGWLDTDGSVHKVGSVGLCVAGRLRAERVQLLLTKCGIRSSIYLTARAGAVTNYGRRSADQWVVWIPDARDIPCHRLDTSRGAPSSCRGKYQTVKSVEYLPGTHDVYCFTEPDEHKGVFNNTLTYQCEDIGAELTRFLGPFFGDDLIVEVRAPRIDDHELKHQRLSMAIQGKCITKNQLLRELELPTTEEPWGDDIAGEMPQQQQGMPGMPGMPAPGGAPAEQPTPDEGGAAMEQGQEQEEPDPLAALLGVEEEPGEETRPTPGGLGEGALGPRKRFQFNGSH